MKQIIAQEKPVPMTFYTPESELRSPRRLIGAMWRDLLNSRELAWRLMVRDISARYRTSVLGVLWAFVSPIMTASVFVVLNKAGAINIGNTDIPYPVFVMCGTVLWQFFLSSLNLPLGAVSGGRSLLVKVNFPREALILSSIGQLLFDLSIKLLVLAVVFAIYRIPPTWGLLVAPFAIMMLMLLGIVIGMVLMPIGMLYSDVSAALSAITALWFFVTPVVYPLPERWPYVLLINLNPVTPLLVGARDLATKGALEQVMPFAIICGFTICGLFVVWVLYRVSLPILLERLSA
jgi:lipopolysaccharide transport system permease protein